MGSQKKHVDIIYINTQLQLADAFTKPLGRESFLSHRDVLFGQPPSAELAKYLESVQQFYHHKRTFDEIDNQLHCHSDWTDGRFK